VTTSSQTSAFAIERLTRFLNALGNDVEIVVRPKPRARDQATLRVVSARRRSA
jgi:hypothetical protein